MYKFSCFLLLAFLGCAYCLIPSVEDDKKNVQLLFAPSPDSPDIILDETNTNVIDKSKKTVIIVHGWLEDRTTNFYPAMFNEYHKKGGYNVIRVDWSKYSRTEYLTSAQVLVKRVGNLIGDYINTLNIKEGIELSTIHIVGHSLGSHVAGFAGKRIKSVNGPIGRISGLDPAGPTYYAVANEDNRLNPQDADMVDCLYTNRAFLGIAFEVGTHNFYANSASIQPGCPIDNDNKTTIFACSHQRSTSLYSESINSDRFIAVKIKSFNIIPIGADPSVKVIFGENTNAPPGSYQFDTNKKEPYALG